MSDEAAENGGLSWGQDDTDAVDTAVIAASSNSVRVAPVLCSGYPSGMESHAQRLADDTGGRVFHSTDPAGDLADGILEIVKYVAVDNDGDGVPDCRDTNPNDPCDPNPEFCFPPQDCGVSNTPHWDDDGDGQTDEETDDGLDNDGAGPYTVEVIGTGDGAVDFEFAHSRTDGTSVLVSYQNVTTTVNSKASIDLSLDTATYSLSVDKDGDGTEDYTIEPEIVETSPRAPTGLAASLENQEILLSWNANPESDIAGYHIYYDNDVSGPPYYATTADQGGSPIDVGNTTNYTLSGLPGGTYYLAITAYDSDGYGSRFSNEVVVFIPYKTYLPVILRNYTPSTGPIQHPPNTPTNPSPTDGAIDQSVDVNLSWTGGDPDSDNVTYDVYFEASDTTPDVLICDDVTSASCDPGPLNQGTHYYWQVVASDGQKVTTGPVWDFTTEATQDDLILTGTAADRAIHLSWDVNTILPPMSTWQIDYQSETGTLYPAITGIISPTRAYTLAGLPNYVWYTVTLNAMLDSSPILTDTVRAMPADTNQAIIIDHTSVNINAVPQHWIEEAKDTLHIAYGHTSHGSQLTSGMSGLVGFANGGGRGLALPDDIFAWNNGGTGGALDLHDYAMGGDVGYYPQWVSNTLDYLGTPDPATGRGTNHPDVNVIIWSWCGQVNNRDEQSMLDTYLLPMTQLEQDYPGVTFIYMTGHANGGGEEGNVHIRNQQIRDYCIANNKALYDLGVFHLSRHHLIAQR
jgi:hypothetical protein